MSCILIKKVKIIDKNSPYHKKIMDIFIENGKIKKISEKIDNGKRDCKIINGNNIYISPGWFDFGANFKDPGFENIENLYTGCRAAANGGYTGVLLTSDTKPAIDNKTAVKYILDNCIDNIVDVFPSGSLTKNNDGKELSEMYDMYSNGAKAFGDNKSIKDTGLFLRALLYSKSFNTLIISVPYDDTLVPGAQINEGKISTIIGIKGIPSIAESIMLYRDIKLLEYSQSRLHIKHVTCKESIENINKAKKNKLNLSCGISALHLLLSDDELINFNSRMKVLPPLKDKKEIKNIVNALKNDIIDIIYSGHEPVDKENKEKEFQIADFGVSMIDVSFSVINTALFKKVSLEKIIDKISIKPRELLGIKVPMIKEGEFANVTIFNAEDEYELKENNFLSKSKENPLIGRKLRGYPIAVINKNKFFECNFNGKTS